MSSGVRIAQLTEINQSQSKQIFYLIKQLTSNYRQTSLVYHRKVLKNPAVKVLAAIDSQNKIIGIITLVIYNKLDGVKKLYIEDFVVDQQFRGRGIGTSLLKAAIDLARKNNCHTVHLTSASHRTEANRLYHQFGFQLYQTNYYKYSL